MRFKLLDSVILAAPLDVAIRTAVNATGGPEDHHLVTATSTQHRVRPNAPHEIITGAAIPRRTFDCPHSTVLQRRSMATEETKVLVE